MFQRFLAWIREVWHKMIGQSTVKDALGIDVALSSDIAEALQLWGAMYENKSEWLTGDVKTLNLPASIAGEIARAVTIEMSVDVTGSPRADFLQAQLETVLSRVREKVEQGAAVGGLVFKPYVDGGRIAIDTVRADQFFPVAFDATGNITSAIFVDQRQIGDKYYKRLEYHAMVDYQDGEKRGKGCQIVNRAFKSDNAQTLGSEVQLTEVSAWAGLQSEVIISNTERPLYGYFRYPQANNIDPSSPLGVSCYSRAVDLIQQADVLWSQLVWEFESGKRAIYVDPMAFGRDAAGQLRVPDKRLFRSIDLGGGKAIGEGSGEDLFHDWTPEFRDEAYKRGLNSMLQRIEFACGLAYGTLSDPQVEAKTATEVKTSQQRSYATVTDAQKALQTALDQLLYAMDVWASLGAGKPLAPKGTFTAVYSFDDSVITDKELQMSQDRQTVGMGAMPKWMFLVRNYGLDEATARKWIDETQAEQPEDMFGGGAQ